MTHSQPPDPITKYRPGVNKTLATAIHLCIEPDPKDRCSSIDQFLRAISKVKYEDE
jgi:hypothetical protein